MMRVLLLGLLMLLLPAQLWAQKGLKVSMEGESKLVLSSYTGLDLIVVDSMERNVDGFFVYEPILPKGMYVLDSDGASIEFLSIGEPLSMKVECADDDCSVCFDASPENTRWMAYQRLRRQFRYGNENPELYHVLIDSLVGDATDYAARLIRVDVDSQLRSFDFEDPAMIPTNVLTTKIVHFLEMSGDDFIKASGHILSLAKVDINSYAFALEYLLKGFTALGLSEVTDYLLNFPQLAEGEITQEEGAMLQKITEPYQKVKVGAKAPNIQGLTVDGKHYELYASNASRIIVVFWSVDCEYCHDFLVQIRNHLDLRRDYELVTYALADNREEVVRELKKLRLRGYHFYDDARWEGKAFLDYHVVSTPTVFLLDRDKTIVCKPYNWEELNQNTEYRRQK